MQLSHPSLTVVRSVVCALWVTSACSVAEETSTGVVVRYVTAPDPVAGRYIVGLKTNGASPAAVDALIALTASKHGVADYTAYPASLGGFAADLSPQQLSALSADGNVALIEEDGNWRLEQYELPDEIKPYLMEKMFWHLDRIDQRAIPLDNAWYAPALQGAGVNVYVIDTGLRHTHQVFGTRALGAHSTIDDGYGTGDCHGHGTYVAGIIGGSLGGVAPKAMIHGVRAFDCDGRGTTSEVLAALEWVTTFAQHPAVVNLSFGFGARVPVVDAAVARSIESGLTYVASAGNGNVDACGVTPAGVPEVITVGGMTFGDRRAPFSNHGPCVDLMGPAVGISSARHDDDVGLRSFMGGTSFAAPIVAGVAAQILERDPSLTPDQVYARLVATASPLPTQDAMPRSPSRMCDWRETPALVPHTKHLDSDDTTPPGVTVLLPAANAQHPATEPLRVVVLATDSGPPGRLELRLGGKTLTRAHFGQALLLERPPAGKQQFEVVAIDAAGNATAVVHPIDVAPAPVCTEEDLRFDRTGDGRVDYLDGELFNDVLINGVKWADLNGDGKVDVTDGWCPDNGCWSIWPRLYCDSTAPTQSWWGWCVSRQRRADRNGDSRVDEVDEALFRDVVARGALWADANRDGKVNGFDTAVFLEHRCH